MIGNARKFNLILSTNGQYRSLIKSTKCGKLLGIKIDSTHTFDKHIEVVSKTASNRGRTLLELVILYMTIEN